MFLVLVCDRYSAYKKLARLAAGRLVLAFCWAHVRRDFIKVAAARGDLEDWKDQWLSPDPAPVQAERAALAISRSRQVARQEEVSEDAIPSVPRPRGGLRGGGTGACHR